MTPKVMIILGSASDIKIAEKSIKVLEKLKITYSLRVASAHRTHDKVKELVLDATEEGVEVFIGIAGLAAHLPGAIAAYTYRPVIGVPVDAKLGGLDALYACSQMPFPAPVATVGVDRGDNGAILAGQIIATYDNEIKKNISELRVDYQNKVKNGEEEVLSKLNGDYINKDFLSEDKGEKKGIEVEKVENAPLVSIIAGSYSDLDIAKKVTSVLDRMNISYDLAIISPIRYANRFEEYMKKMEDVKLFIAVSGLSALVTGSIVALSEKPVIGVPCSNKRDINDSLLTMIQMPPGVPVGTVGSDNGRNAAILAGEILGITNDKIEDNLKWIKYKTAEL
ncbi:MAG: 5-(carboxyamino)imidazole ribonucleotide mutase [Methanobacteriaceae archaeon]|nr:5-(carboxyamino)imidazole ribonucleotide mutase [Methanobacteriaceae archaeon]